MVLEVLNGNGVPETQREKLDGHKENNRVKLCLTKIV